MVITLPFWRGMGCLCVGVVFGFPAPRGGPLFLSVWVRIAGCLVFILRMTFGGSAYSWCVSDVAGTLERRLLVLDLCVSSLTPKITSAPLILVAGFVGFTLSCVDT